MAIAKTIMADITARNQTSTDIMITESTARRIIADSQHMPYTLEDCDKEVLNDLWSDFINYHLQPEDIDSAPGCPARYAISAVIEFAVDGCCPISSR